MTDEELLTLAREIAQRYSMPQSEYRCALAIANFATACVARERKREREACAMKCDALKEVALKRASEYGATAYYSSHQEAVASGARECATAIRARTP